MANDFNADSFYAPFFSDNEKANAMLNNYVLDKTRGLINPKLELANEMYFALVNVLYLKDIWNGDDSKLSYTNKEYDFITYSGEVVKQALLKTEYIDGKAYETESFSHFYVMTDAGYRLKFILPKDGYTVDEVFTVDTIMNVNNITDYNRLDEENGYSNLTRVMFPKFEASYKNDIDAVLKNTFGIRSFYNNGQHMLGLTDENLRLERINHQAKLIVDEKGIEGAAVTVLETAPESALDGNFYDFIVNRAFAYLLTDKDGNILFSGVVNKI